MSRKSVIALIYLLTILFASAEAHGSIRVTLLSTRYICAATSLIPIADKIIVLRTTSLIR